ncbi:MAG: addiction module protein [FCB group bacterium]|jgi:hypothetical protein|nr:addiction module protein [FCB group bacterium]
MTVREILDEAISLPVEERAMLADSLLRSLNAPSEERDLEWAAAAQRRLQELRSGEQLAVPGAAVFARIWKRFE